MYFRLTFLKWIIAITISTISYSQIESPTIAIQGVIVPPVGSSAEGNYSLTFNLYTQKTGGVSEWTEIHPDVPVALGVYAVELGSLTELSLPFDQQYYIGVTVGNGTEMTPRVKMTVAPAALAYLGTQHILPSTGNVGIGTKDPSNILTVYGNADFTGNVGIGTATPTNKLSVVGSADFTQNVEISGNLGIGTPSQTNNLSVVGSANFTGNVGIGTTAPTHSLHVEGILRNDYPNNDYDVWIQGGESNPGDSRNLALLGYQYGGVDRLHLNYQGEYSDGTILGGNVGIGTLTPTNPLSVVGRISSTGSTAGIQINGWGIVNDSGDDLSFWNDAYRMTLTSNGFLGIGTTTPTRRFHVKDYEDLSLADESGFVVFGYIHSFNIGFDNNEIQARDNGSSTTLYLNASGGSVDLPSDRRLKRDIVPIDEVLNKVRKLTPVSYEWKNNKLDNKDRNFGFIAQDFINYFPDIVSEPEIDDNPYYSMQYSGIGVIAIKAIQEQQEIIDAQAEKIEDLKTRLARIEEKLK